MIELFRVDKIGDKHKMCLNGHNYDIVFEDFKLKEGNIISFLYFIYFIFKIKIWEKVDFNGIDIKNSKGVILLLFFYFFLWYRYSCYYMGFMLYKF